ncbi:chemotaxis-specific protein-glutamate methyltransferase CheB [Qipengyuania spongiae]|uniref:Protein-glutamate methylesterase/protein-glutamine glutaminase n=1 Tax=Qipengyuania spongiae TaxID=2909673 RepID=A0ABY5T0L4_9SPHN|nr:chemotaxis-specific protein-glutamate methyltransferase CheB [Qipengyuania spongiae]UVI40297.1 chemotaxis-specific protein-glutamate methyltransferase CheB [Qipengyuania spongiae]
MAAVLRPSSIARPSSLAPEPPPTLAETVKVMLVDDSLTVRTVFGRMIDRESDLEVVGQAETAERALLLLRSTKVDVILLDLEMPGMGGLKALPEIMQKGGDAQVLVVSSLAQGGAETTLAALSMGAADTMLKPRPGQFDDGYRSSLVEKIRALGARRMDDENPAASHGAVRHGPPGRKRPQVVAIGASTGGIHALNLFLRELPAQFDLPILITQHLPGSFVPVFAQQMESAARRPAILAAKGTAIERGKLYIAGGDGHLVVRRMGGRPLIALSNERTESGCLPSVDPMFASLSEAFDGHVAAVLLSGMGRDGTKGAETVAAAGGVIYAQNEASSAVWGMPRGVVEKGLASCVLPPDELARKLVASTEEVACG